MTDTAPRVSTVLRDLQRTLFFRIILALIVRLAVNATGRPSGMKATATETQSTMSVGTLIQLGYSLLSQAALRISVNIFSRYIGCCAYQRMMTRIIIKPMIEQMIYTKFRTSLSSVDKPVLGSLVSLAILPKTVRFPVATTMAMQVPETQCDPCKPIHLVSR